MIDVSKYEQRLQWLKEWMNKQIDNKGYSYGFKEWVFIKDFHRSLDMDKFNDFCIVKKYDQHKQDQLLTNKQ